VSFRWLNGSNSCGKSCRKSVVGVADIWPSRSRVGSRIRQGLGCEAGSLAFTFAMGIPHLQRVTCNVHRERDEFLVFA